MVVVRYDLLWPHQTLQFFLLKNGTSQRSTVFRPLSYPYSVFCLPLLPPKALRNVTEALLHKMPRDITCFALCRSLLENGVHKPSGVKNRSEWRCHQDSIRKSRFDCPNIHPAHSKCGVVDMNWQRTRGRWTRRSLLKSTNWLLPHIGLFATGISIK